MQQRLTGGLIVVIMPLVVLAVGEGGIAAVDDFAGFSQAAGGIHMPVKGLLYPFVVEPDRLAAQIDHAAQKDEGDEPEHERARQDAFHATAPRSLRAFDGARRFAA